MSAELEIACVGDQFITAALLERAALDILKRPFRAILLDLPWPEVPFHTKFGPAGPEISEYSGDPKVMTEFLKDADALLTHLAPLTAATIAAAPKLRFVGVTRGGPVNVNLGAARERGITVANVPGRNATAVAEFTIAAILSTIRRITEGHVGMVQQNWRGDLYSYDRTGDELSDLTVGVLGYGHVGQRVVRLLRPFGCRILVSDPLARLNVYDEAEGVEQVDLDTLIAQSDVISLHTRLTAETTKIISRERIAAMRPGTVIVNTARGELIDEAALIEALVSGRLGGAALDIFENEPLEPGSQLVGVPNVTLTPHIAGASRRVATQAAKRVAEDLRRFLKGVPVLNPCM